MRALPLTALVLRAQFHVKPKGEDGANQVKGLLALAAAPLGVVNTKDRSSDGVAAVWASAVASSGRATADCTAGLACVLAVHDEAARTCVIRAATLSARVLQSVLLQKMERCIDDEKPARHSKLADQAAEALADPKAAPLNLSLNADFVEAAYPFCVQSGGIYNTSYKAGSDDALLAIEPPSVIVVQLGCKYKDFCANVGRTYLLDAPQAVSGAYAALCAAHAAAVAALTDGNTCGAVYDAAAAALAAHPQGASLQNCLAKSLGSAIGLELQDRCLQLASGNTQRIAAGMAFNVATALTEVTNAKLYGRSGYALLLADTVLVKPAGESPEVLTASALSKASDISYEIAAGDDERLDEPAKPEQKAAARQDAGAAAEARRKAQQDELGARKNAETLQRLTEASRRNAQAASSSGAATEFIVYKHVADVPADRSRDGVIVVDRSRESVLLPIYGQLVPFHIGAIKNAAATQEGSAYFIRLHFHVPGAGFGAAGGYPPAAKHPDCSFVREATFRTTDGRHASNVVSEIKSLRTEARQRASEAAERSSLVRQEKLSLAKGKVHRLQDVWLRPTFGGRGRKQSGTLELHANGFRYSTSKADERVDIIFGNIKHCFFQPADKELITLLHFHLHDPIMVGKKKTKDVQVFAEVMDAVQNLDGGRRSAYDPDELEDEQRERQRRNRINQEFLLFTKRCQEHWDQACPQLELSCEIPFRELQFPGVPFKTSAFVVPSVNALVELVEMPFLVLTLAEVEVVNLERVSFNLKNFDMAVVFKDLTRDVHRIDAIDMKHLDTIKEWLNSVGIKYYESKMNLNWKPILKTILDDPQQFVEGGGWDFLDLEKGDSDDEGGSDEESDDFRPSDGDEDESEEESESESMDEEDDDDDEEFDEEEEEEEGKVCLQVEKFVRLMR